MRLWTVAAAAILATGCQVIEYEVGGPGDPAPGALALQPLEVGTTWSYETSRADGSEREVKEVAVIATEVIDGREAAVVESVRGKNRTGVWLAGVDGRVLRLREELWQHGTLVDRRGFSPGSLRTPATAESLREGAILDGSYVEKALASDDRVIAERQRTPSYEVEAVAEEVTTPAGTFFAVRLRKLGDDGEDGKRIWYAPGVGKVREEGGRIEVLRRWSKPKP
mgnify:CR=1 FL=1